MTGVDGNHITSTFRVGRYRCTMSIPLVKGVFVMSCEWEPDAPKPGTLTKKELRDYRRGRDALIEEVARHLGINVLVVE
jgi:hypothetical protein